MLAHVDPIVLKCRCRFRYTPSSAGQNPFDAEREVRRTAHFPANPVVLVIGVFTLATHFRRVKADFAGVADPRFALFVGFVSSDFEDFAHSETFRVAGMGL